MQTTKTTLLPASRTLNCRVITPRKRPTDGRTRNSPATTAIIPFRRDDDCPSGCDALRRHEPGDEEVLIANDAKGLLMGLAIIVAVRLLIQYTYFHKLEFQGPIGKKGWKRG